MSTIFVATPDGQQRELSTPDFEVAWRAESLGAQAHYWQEGMEGWEPVTQYHPTSGLQLAKQPDPAPSEQRSANLHPVNRPAREVQAYTIAKSIEGLTQVVIAFIWLHLFTLGAGSIAAICILMLRSSLPDSVMAVLGMMAMVGGYGSIGVYVITAIIFLVWIYRAKANCHGFGAEGLEYTPGWAVGWFFVPIMSLFKPFSVMRETWQVSTNPRDWRSVNTPVLLHFWWGFWLVNNFVGNFVGQLNFEDLTPDGQRLNSSVMFLSLSLSISLAVAASMLVWGIYHRQKSLVTNSIPVDLGTADTAS